MTTIQLIIAVAGFISIIAGFIAGAWLNQRALERQMDAFRNEMRAEFASVRAEFKGEIGSLRGEVLGEIGMLRAEQTATREKVERIERQLEALFVPKPR
jgi:hypothetical protein